MLIKCAFPRFFYIRKQAFINLIGVLEESNQKKDIASQRLWLKNGFGISPVKDVNGQIPGSFVTYVCKR